MGMIDGEDENVDADLEATEDMSEEQGGFDHRQKRWKMKKLSGEVAKKAEKASKEAADKAEKAAEEAAAKAKKAAPEAAAKAEKAAEELAAKAKKAAEEAAAKAKKAAEEIAAKVAKKAGAAMIDGEDENVDADVEATEDMSEDPGGFDHRGNLWKTKKTKKMSNEVSQKTEKASKEVVHKTDEAVSKAEEAAAKVAKKAGAAMFDGKAEGEKLTSIDFHGP